MRLGNTAIMSDNPTINLDPVKCFKLFDESFNRIKYFPRIADGIDVGSLPTDWGITRSDSGIRYGMNQPNEEQRQYLLNGFQYFLRRYLVRDCIESFALCLDELCLNLLLLSNLPRRVQSSQTLYDILEDEEKKFLKDFQDKGLSNKNGKIGLLRTRFGLELSDKHKKTIKSLKDIRDCLTHRNGITSTRDGFSAEGQKIKFKWLTLDFFVVGTETGFKQPFKIGEVYKEGVNCFFKIKEHSKIVDVGSSLEFSSVEIYDIAHSLQLISMDYIGKIQQAHSKSND